MRTLTVQVPANNANVTVQLPVNQDPRVLTVQLPANMGNNVVITI